MEPVSRELAGQRIERFQASRHFGSAMIRGCFLRVQETLLIFIGEHNKAFPVVTMRVSDKDLLLLTPAHVNVFFTLWRSSLTNVAAKMDLMERKFRQCLRDQGANVHGFFSSYAAERSGRTETLTSRTAADETASTSTASAPRSQRTARKSFNLSSVGRSICIRFSSPLTSAHARPKRDAPHEET
jgi:hypothetical protein